MGQWTCLQGASPAEQAVVSAAAWMCCTVDVMMVDN